MSNDNFEDYGAFSTAKEVVQETFKEHFPDTVKARKGHKPTAQTRMVVQLMSANLFQEDQICQILKINKRQLRKNYKYELRATVAWLEARVLERFFELLEDKDNPAQAARMVELYLTRKMGWAENIKADFTHPTVVTTVAQKPDIDISPEQRLQRELLLKLQNSRPDTNDDGA